MSLDPLTYLCYGLGVATSWLVDYAKRLPLVQAHPKITAFLVGAVWPFVLHAIGRHDTPLSIGWILFCAFGSLSGSVTAREVVTKPGRTFLAFSRRILAGGHVSAIVVLVLLGALVSTPALSQTPIPTAPTVWTFGPAGDSTTRYADGTVVPHRSWLVFLNGRLIDEIDVHLHRRYGPDRLLDTSFGATFVTYSPPPGGR